MHQCTVDDYVAPSVNDYDAGEPERADRSELMQLRLLDGVDMKAVEGLLKLCPVRQLVTGELLVRAGETCPALYFVLEGRLRVRDPSSAIADSFVEVGDGFGELSLFQWTPSTSTVVALEPTRVIVIDAQAVDSLIAASHALARNMLSLLTERLRSSAATIGANTQLAANNRRHVTLDDATGLHNRRWFEAVLPRQIMRSSMAHKNLALLLIDIDDFSNYNAQFGYEAGDQALYAVAQTLLGSVRPTDLVARYDASRFAVVLPESDLAGARVVADRIAHAVSEAVVLMADESILPPVTVSIGAAVLEPFSDAPALLQAAQAALQVRQEEDLLQNVN